LESLRSKGVLQLLQRGKGALTLVERTDVERTDVERTGVERTCVERTGVEQALRGNVGFGSGVANFTLAGGAQLAVAGLGVESRGGILILTGGAQLAGAATGRAGGLAEVTPAWTGGGT